jgi:hypothetical protein
MCNRTQRNHRPLPRPGPFRVPGQGRSTLRSLRLRQMHCHRVLCARQTASLSRYPREHCASQRCCWRSRLSPVRRITGPQGPSRGSPSIEGLQTLLAPAALVKTRWSPSHRFRYVEQIRIYPGSLPRVAMSQPQPDYLITAAGYCQPLAEVSRNRSQRLSPSRVTR